MAQTPKSFNLSMTAQQVHEALLSVAGKFDKSKILTDIVAETASNSNVPSTLAVLNKFNEVGQRFDNLGNLASKDSVALGSSDVSGTLPINRGGTGGATAEAARAALDVLSSQAIQDLIDASVPEIQEVDLGTNAAKGILPVSKGGTGASTQSQARNNLGVYSQSETISQIATKICAADGYTFKGFFSTGFEINDYKQIGIADSGVFYQYVGSTLPKTVTAATLPSTDPDFVAWQPARDAFLVASAKAESQGFKLKGRFQTGFTIESILECGLSADGGIYKYVGDVANLPLAVPAGSVVDNVLFDELFFGEGGGTGAGTVVVETEDEIPTSNLVNGRRCYVIATGDEFIYVVEDGESSGQWIQISSGGGGGTAKKLLALSTDGFPDVSLYPDGTELMFRDTLEEFTIIDGYWSEDGTVGDDVDVTAASHLTLVQAQASDLKVGQYVRLTDRGYSLWKVEVSDTSGGIALSPNWLVPVHTKMVDIRTFGAVGGEDCTDSIKAALEFCRDNIGYEICCIPPSANGLAYEFTSIKVYSQTTLLGLGGLLKYKDGTVTDANASYYPINNLGEDRVTYKDLIVEGNAAGNPIKPVVCDIVTVTGFRSQILNCKLFNAVDSCIMFSATERGMCKWNYVEGASDLGIYVNASASTFINEAQVSGNIIKGCVAGGVGIKRQSKHVVVHDNTITDCGNGITIEDFGGDNHPTDLTITSNTMRRIGWTHRGPTVAERGISISKLTNSIVADNKVYECSGACIHLGELNGVSITGNHLHGYPASPSTGGLGNVGIENNIDLVSDCDISGNFIRDVADEGIYLGNTQESTVVRNNVKSALSALRINAACQGVDAMLNKLDAANGVDLEVYAGATGRIEKNKLINQTDEFSKMGYRVVSAGQPLPPNGTLVPRFVGEEIVHLAGPTWYKAIGLNAGDWA